MKLTMSSIQKATQIEASAAEAEAAAVFTSCKSPHKKMLITRLHVCYPNQPHYVGWCMDFFFVATLRNGPNEKHKIKETEREREKEKKNT